MSTHSPVRIGANDNGADKKALFKELVQNMIISKFESTTLMGANTHEIKNISNGTGAEFKVFESSAEGKYHTAGNETTAGSAKFSKFLINVDDIFYERFDSYELDELMADYNAVNQLTTEASQILVRNYEKNVFRTGILASRQAASTGRDAGTEIVAATALTDGVVLAGAIYDMMAAMDEKNVPGERVVYVKPQQYYNLVQNLDAINKDYGGMGSYADGKILKIGGATIQSTNYLPQENVSGTFGNKYDGDFTNVAALVMTKEAVGTVNLRDVRVDMEERKLHFGDTVQASYVKGHGVLKPACSGTIVTTATV